ncbi:MAG TPA: hypothetical protein VEK15_13135 [Vicinamibacteria bacterium]|nr:hypothetical protein [Vicinamibacteria bacterium]
MLIRRRSGTLTLYASALAFAGCSDTGSSGSGGTSSSTTITAPGIVGPNATTPISEQQPTLTVTNASVSSGATPTYTFHVSSDQSFGSLAAQASGVGQGSGQTSWQVDSPLGDGAYFWRARAEAEGTSGPFSAVAQFAIASVGGGSGETLLVLDPLTGGTTLATDRGGGTLTDQGWRVENNGDFLRYEVPTVVDGYVQWENLGLTPRGVNEASHMLFGMWDPSAGAFRQNAFRVHVQKLWNNPHNPPFLRFRWISQGREADADANFTDWDPGTVYTWRVDWGPAEGANTARVFLDGDEIMQIRYNRPYQPNTHWIELGIEERHESVIDAVYRNFAVVRRGQ